MKSNSVYQTYFVGSKNPKLRTQFWKASPILLALLVGGLFVYDRVDLPTKTENGVTQGEYTKWFTGKNENRHFWVDVNFKSGPNRGMTEPAKFFHESEALRFKTGEAVSVDYGVSRVFKQVIVADIQPKPKL